MTILLGFLLFVIIGAHADIQTPPAADAKMPCREQDLDFLGGVGGETRRACQLEQFHPERAI